MILIEDKFSYSNSTMEQHHDYKKFKWDTLRKTIFRLINKLSISNIRDVVGEILNEDLIWGRGLFCNAIMKSQVASQHLSNVFAALVAEINSKLPGVGLVLVKRVVCQFKKAYANNDRLKLLFTSKLLAHLVNQSVAHQVIAIDVLSLLLGNPNEVTIEIAVCFCVECGSLLQHLSSHCLDSVFEEFHALVHEGVVETKVQRMIEWLFVIRRSRFVYYPAIIDELDLVEVEEQVSHVVSLLHEIDPETSLDVFRPDMILEERETDEDDDCDAKSLVLGEDFDDEEISSSCPL